MVVEFSVAMLESLASSVLPTNESQALPPSFYTDEEFFAFERETLFSHEWLCVGRADQVPSVGDFVAIELLGEPLVLVRGRDTMPHVMSAVCQHRGMILAEGCGNAKT
ncbi:MAG TPA: Rieske 2Fe-2S domain-containing protein, partial [Acidimicrobiales bacterium]|nr:Rieske 2Fe-2S domain-containing protein [Acidimicrobiales bacterium]